MSFSVIHRFLARHETISFLDQLESTEEFYWTRRERLRKHHIRGVPAKQITLALPEGGIIEDGPPILVEIGEKSGRFDGAIRPHIAIRHWWGWDGPGTRQQVEACPRGTLHIDRHGPDTGDAEHGIIVVSANWIGADLRPDSWMLGLRAYRSTLRPDGLAAIVMWHWDKWYQALIPKEEAQALADSFGTRYPEVLTLTLAEANRLASRDLYAAAVAAGWVKLTKEDRARLRIDQGGCWQREEVVAVHRARYRGYRATGAGDYTHDAAQGRAVRPACDECGGVGRDVIDGSDCVACNGSGVSA